jgi:hypothetical protein
MSRPPHQQRTRHLAFQAEGTHTVRPAREIAQRGRIGWIRKGVGGGGAVQHVLLAVR